MGFQNTWSQTHGEGQLRVLPKGASFPIFLRVARPNRSNLAPDLLDDGPRESR